MPQQRLNFWPELQGQGALRGVKLGAAAASLGRVSLGQGGEDGAVDGLEQFLVGDAGGLAAVGFEGALGAVVLAFEAGFVTEDWVRSGDFVGLGLAEVGVLIFGQGEDVVGEQGVDHGADFAEAPFGVGHFADPSVVRRGRGVRSGG